MNGMGNMVKAEDGGDNDRKDDDVKITETQLSGLKDMSIDDKMEVDGDKNGMNGNIQSGKDGMDEGKKDKMKMQSKSRSGSIHSGKSKSRSRSASKSRSRSRSR